MKEGVLLLVGTHATKQMSVLLWGEKKGEYLDNKEVVTSSATATTHLAVLAAYEKERESMVAGQIALLTEMGATIRNTKCVTV